MGEQKREAMWRPAIVLGLLSWACLLAIPIMPSPDPGDGPGGFAWMILFLLPMLLLSALFGFITLISVIAWFANATKPRAKWKIALTAGLSIPGILLTALYAFIGIRFS